MSTKLKKGAKKAHHRGRVTTRPERRCSNGSNPSGRDCRYTSRLITADGDVPVCSWCGRGLPVDPRLAVLARRFKR